MREIRSMEELKMAQVELQHKIAIKELQLQAHTKSLKDLVNPMTYINLLISKLSIVENIATSFYKGYRTVKDMIEEYRKKETT